MKHVFSRNSVAMFAAIMLAPSVFAVPSPATAQAQANVGITGAWSAPFASGTWTFEFRQENGAWSGRYMSSKYQKWHDLKDLTVEGNRVRFAVEAQPTLDFDLTLKGAALTGELILGKSRSVPFVAERVS